MKRNPRREAKADLPHAAGIAREPCASPCANAIAAGDRGYS
jgi:hypothetical protein